MKVLNLCMLFATKNAGPRLEVVIGQQVVTDMTLVTRWRVEQEDGTVDLYDGEPRFQTDKKGWPKIEKVTAVELKLGKPTRDTDARAG